MMIIVCLRGKMKQTLVLGPNPDEKMAHRESIFLLCNESADRLVQVCRANASHQIEELQRERQSIGASK